MLWFADPISSLNAQVMDCTILNLWNVNTGDNGTEAVVNAIIDVSKIN